MRPPRNPLASWSLSLISRDAVFSAMPVGLTTRVPVVDEVSLAKEETIPHVREVSCHLLHPLPVWVRGYPTDAHAASGDIDDKQDMVADEPERVHNLDGEQVGASAIKCCYAVFEC